MRLTAALMILLFSLLAEAQERVLVPLAFAEVPGANGSRWTAAVTLFNGGTTAARFIPSPRLCPSSSPVCNPPLDYTLQPGALLHMPYGFAFGHGRQGIMIEFLTGDAAAIAVHVRIRELSRGADAVGTELRAVRAHEMLTGVSQLIDVTTGPSLRTTLRIYRTDTGEPSPFSVAVFGDSADPLHEQITIVPGATPDGIVPGFAALFLPSGAGERQRIRVEPLATGVRYWTFASVTNNESNLFTTITPN
ncbi:MAG TPA: hypothetical protein VF701_07245 [Thermoanaerobaculia bacterium]